MVVLYLMVVIPLEVESAALHLVSSLHLDPDLLDPEELVHLLRYGVLCVWGCALNAHPLH